jgi:hypothetical protein
MNDGITERCYDGMNNRNHYRFNLEKHFHTVGKGLPLFSKDSSDFPAVQLLSLLMPSRQLRKLRGSAIPGVSWEAPFRFWNKNQAQKKTPAGVEKADDLKMAQTFFAPYHRGALRRIQDHFAKTSTVAFWRVFQRGHCNKETAG